MSSSQTIELPGLDCGLCGSRTCQEFAARLQSEPNLISRCIHLSKDQISPTPTSSPLPQTGKVPGLTTPSTPTPCSTPIQIDPHFQTQQPNWRDSLDRPFDFYLEHFPEEPGPREIIIPHNPIITRELNIQIGDVLIGRPLGMSCGCPITHCGVVIEVDHRTGVMLWCVTGPLRPRQEGYKDLGYYIAEGYEGLIHEARCEIKIGMRYYFQPRMCMLQWRHSGLVNFLNRTPDALQVRLEGLWIG